MIGETAVDDHVILIAFGAIKWLDLSADTLYDSLISEQIWLTARLPKGYRLGMKVLFYQSRTGFRGTGTLRGVGSTKASDLNLTVARRFPIKLTLSEVETFAEPIEMKPLVNSLRFVSNKQHWGQSVQFTPRIVALSDLQTIMRSRADA